MFSFVDTLLNRVTMYRLVLYYLLVVWVFALVFFALHILPHNPVDLLCSTLVILGVSILTQVVFARVFKAATNIESIYITAFILALIISPVSWGDAAGVGFLIFASVFATASKYILAIGKKHIFNPAAFGVALAALTIGQSATWWVAGNTALMPLVVIGGLCIVRKIRRFDLVSAFSVVSLVTISLTRLAGDPLTPVLQTFSHSAFFFLAFIMLTEPLTMPAERWSRILYGALVGFLFAPHVHFGSFYPTPEIALLIGNLFAYAVSPQGRFILTLKEKNKLGEGVYEFVFNPDRPLLFLPGQYLEWTLPHARPDSRGNRRYFTIASAPTESTVCLGVKVYEPSSSYKTALMEMPLGGVVSVSGLSGEFTLPKNKKKKLVFIAGGIGITPFRAMAQYMLDAKDARDATLLYSNKTLAEVAYKDVFDRAKEVGLKTVYTITNEKVGEKIGGPAAPAGLYGGAIDAALIMREVPDFKDRVFYLSGPHGMVEAFKKTLRGMGVSRLNIKADYFPGFV